MNTQKSLKILIPIAICLVVAGIFIFKFVKKQESVNPNTQGEIPFFVSSINLDELKKHNQPIIIDFGADACAPCKEMAPALKKLNEDWQGKVIVQFVDVWKNQAAAKGFPVQVIPTQIFYTAQGEPFTPSEALSKEIKFNIYSDKNTDEHLFTAHQGGLSENQMRKIFAEMEIK